MSCSNNASETCRVCESRECNKVPIVEHILSSNDARKIAELTKVMTVFKLEVQDYL